MRARTFLAIWLLFSFYVPMALAQQTAEGLWTTIDDTTGEKRAVVLMVVHDGVLSATIESVYPKPGDTGICSDCPGLFKDKPTKGLQFVWGLRERSPGAWEGGQILDAKNGKIYNVKMTVKDNKLYVRGYIGIAMLGRTQIWERADKIF
jgi:uncharacterized protein (DUF2147 family)